MRSKSKHQDQDERSERASPEKADHSEQANQTPSTKPGGVRVLCALRFFLCTKRIFKKSSGATNKWCLESPMDEALKRNRKEKRTGNFTLDTSSNQSQHQPTSHNTQHTRVKQIHFALCKRTLSPARHVLEDKSYQIRPKINAGDASLLMGSIHKTRLD